jgi:hypothetical protein
VFYDFLYHHDSLLLCGSFFWLFDTSAFITTGNKSDESISEVLNEVIRNDENKSADAMSHLGVARD